MLHNAEVTAFSVNYEQILYWGVFTTQIQTYGNSISAKYYIWKGQSLGMNDGGNRKKAEVVFFYYSVQCIKYCHLFHVKELAARSSIERIKLKPPTLYLKEYIPDVSYDGENQRKRWHILNHIHKKKEIANHFQSERPF